MGEMGEAVQPPSSSINFYHIGVFINIGISAPSFFVMVLLILTRIGLQRYSKLGYMDDIYFKKYFDALFKKSYLRNQEKKERRKTSGKSNLEIASLNEAISWRKAPIAHHFLNFLFLLENLSFVVFVLGLQSFFSTWIGFEVSNTAHVIYGWNLFFLFLGIFLFIVCSAIVTMHICRFRKSIPDIKVQSLSDDNNLPILEYDSERDANEFQQMNYESMQRIPTPKEASNRFVCRNLAADSYVKSVVWGVRQKPFLVALAWLLITLLSITHLLFLFGICVCNQPYVFSTSFTRLFEQKHCPYDTICFPIFAVPEKPHQEMILRFQTRNAPHRAYVLFGTVKGGAKTSKITCKFFDMRRFLTDFESRFAYACDLINLSPNSTYYVEPVVETGDDADSPRIVGEEMKFRTIHNNPNEDVLFASGGDYGINEIGANILKIATKQNPSFIVIGGDLAYENGFPSCNRRFDEFLQSYASNTITDDGYHIPILTCIGNHEGFYGKFKSTRERCPLYLTLLNHKVNETIGTTRSIHTIHQLSTHSAIMMLDSHVISAHEDQTQWIDSTWNSYEYVSRSNRYAAYHAPLYPSARSFFGELSVKGRKYWEPLFLKHNISVCFENHDHIMKRTKIIFNGTIATPEQEQSGTVFVGDGSMGVTHRGEDKKLWYIEKMTGKTHIWIVTSHSPAKGGGTTLKAIDDQGTIIDEFEYRRR